VGSSRSVVASPSKFSGAVGQCTSHSKSTCVPYCFGPYRLGAIVESGRIQARISFIFFKCDFLLDSNTPLLASFASSDVLSDLSLVLNSSSFLLSLSLWVPSSVWPELSEFPIGEVGTC